MYGTFKVSKAPKPKKSTHHRFTEIERAKMATYESLGLVGYILGITCNLISNQDQTICHHGQNHTRNGCWNNQVDWIGTGGKLFSLCIKP